MDTEQLRRDYAYLSPLLLSRSLAYGRNTEESAAILASIPNQYPLYWDVNLRRWQQVQKGNHGTA